MSLNVQKLLYKTSNTTRTLTTIAAADPDLQLLLSANAVYILDINLAFVTGAVPDGKVGIGFIGGSVVTACLHAEVGDAVDKDSTFSGSSASILAGAQINAMSTITFAGNDTANYVARTRLRGMVQTGSAGTLSIIWAQNTSSAVDTTLLAGSNIFYEQVL